MVSAALLQFHITIMWREPALWLATHGFDDLEGNLVGEKHKCKN